MTFEDQKNILQCLRDVLEIAYNSAEPVCCGRPGVECCGSPEPEWRAFEQTIMDTLGPAEKALAESVQAAANQQGILDGSDHVSDASKMVPEMLPIAQRKIEQMGGEVMGVVVRNEAGALAAVTDLGRVTWLDDCVGGPVNHIADASNMVRGNVQAMGDLHFNEEDDYQSAVVIEFDSREDFKAAMQAGRCEFSVLGGDA